MQNNKYRSCLQMLFISLVTAFVIMGCTKEDLSQCTPDTYRLIVKAYDAQGAELTAEIVKEVTLYVFDKDKQFLGVHTDAKLNESIELNYPNHELLTVVAWGNGMQGHQTMPSLAIGDKMEMAFVSLLQTKATMATMQSPDDLFHGAINLTKENIKTENNIPIYRKTSGISITARKLKQYANANDENFTYVLRQTANKINFEGKEAGEFSAYTPEASFDNKQEFVAPIFNILTTSSDIEVDIFHGDIRVATILKDPSGETLNVEAGKTLNILIDFTGDISVSVSVTDWGVQQVWKEFN